MEITTCILHHILHKGIKHVSEEDLLITVSQSIQILPTTLDFLENIHGVQI